MTSLADIFCIARFTILYGEGNIVFYTSSITEVLAMKWARRLSKELGRTVQVENQDEFKCYQAHSIWHNGEEC